MLRTEKKVNTIAKVKRYCSAGSPQWWWRLYNLGWRNPVLRGLRLLRHGRRVCGPEQLQQHLQQRHTVEVRLCVSVTSLQLRLPVSRLIGRSVCHNILKRWKVTHPCFCLSTCYVDLDLGRSSGVSESFSCCGWEGTRRKCPIRPRSSSFFILLVAKNLYFKILTWYFACGESDNLTLPA